MLIRHSILFVCIVHRVQHVTIHRMDEWSVECLKCVGDVNLFWILDTNGKTKYKNLEHQNKIQVKCNV